MTVIGGTYALFVESPKVSDLLLNAVALNFVLEVRPSEGPDRRDQAEGTGEKGPDRRGRTEGIRQTGQRGRREEGQRDKGTKRDAQKGTKGQRGEEGAKRQRDIGTGQEGTN